MTMSTATAASDTKIESPLVPRAAVEPIASTPEDHTARVNNYTLIYLGLRGENIAKLLSITVTNW